MADDSVLRAALRSLGDQYGSRAVAETAAKLIIAASDQRDRVTNLATPRDFIIEFAYEANKQRHRAEQAEARVATAQRVAQHFHDGFRTAADNREDWALAARHVTSLILGALAGEQITLSDGDE